MNAWLAMVLARQQRRPATPMAGKPMYYAGLWREGGFYLARVINCSDGAAWAPLGSVTEARTRRGIRRKATDMVATILDAEPGEFMLVMAFCAHDPGTDEEPEHDH